MTMLERIRKYQEYQRRAIETAEKARQLHLALIARDTKDRIYDALKRQTERVYQ